ncbi:MAG: hypothetical protein ACTTJ6_08435, partial [Treponema sp.]
MCKEEKKESVTREYKDSVFVDLFTSYESPISLYNAVSFSNVPANTKVQSLQISNALYTSLRCDLAFT